MPPRITPDQSKTFRIFEYCALAALFAATLLIWITTLPWSPIGPDEPSYKDPSINYLIGKGFTSGAWYAQTSQEFWAGNVPLHALIQIPWFTLFGVSLGSSRAFEWTLILASTAVLYLGISRLKIFASPLIRILFVAAWLGQTSTYVLANQGRPDALGFLIASCLVLTWSIPKLWGRLVALVILSALLPWAGLQLPLAAICVLAFLAAVFRTRFARESVAILLGIFIGFLTLLVFYYVNDSLPAFIASVAPHTTAAGRSAYTYNGWLRGKSFWFVLLCAGCLSFVLIATRQQDRFLRRKDALLSIAFALVLPVVLFLGGKFTTNYIWIPTLGFLIAFLHLCANAEWGRRRLMRLGLIAVLVSSGLYGPAETLLISYWNRAPEVHSETTAYASSHIREDDVVVYSQFVFYSAKLLSKDAFYANWYASPITAKEKSSVSLLLCSPQRATEFANICGGEWFPVDSGIEVPVFRLFRPPVIERLVAYRRASTDERNPRLNRE